MNDLFTSKSLSEVHLTRLGELKEDWISSSWFHVLLSRKASKMGAISLTEQCSKGKRTLDLQDSDLWFRFNVCPKQEDQHSDGEETCKSLISEETADLHREDGCLSDQFHSPNISASISEAFSSNDLSIQYLILICVNSFCTSL